MAAVVAVGAFALVAHVGLGPASTSARFSAAISSPTSDFTGATLSPTVAPVITPRVENRLVRLDWTRVDSTRSVSYSVERTSKGANPTTICSGASAPTVNGALVSCVDYGALADGTYTYTEMPYLDIAGSTPWSLPRSAASGSFLVPRLVHFANGSDVSSTGTNIVVPYPPGTNSGDLLLLVSVSGRNKSPSTPTGWTSLVGRGVSGSASVHLFVAWRVADSAGSVTLDPQANGVGASTRIINYGRVNGNTTNPVVATSTIVSGTSSASTTFTSPSDIVTNAANAVVVSIVATNGATSLALSMPMNFTLRVSANSTPGSGSVSLGVADTNVAATGGPAASPTWTQSGTPQTWIHATVAFR